MFSNDEHRLMDIFLRSVGDVVSSAATSMCSGDVASYFAYGDHENHQEAQQHKLMPPQQEPLQDDQLSGISIGRRVVEQQIIPRSGTSRVAVDTGLLVTSGRSVEFRLSLKIANDDTDLVALGQLFRQVPEDIRDKMRCTRIPDLHIERTRIAPSTVTGGGLGLFATRNIAEDELITLYPGDVLLCWPDDNGKGEAQEIAIRLGRNTSESFATAPFDFGSDAWRYGVHTSATRAICGDPSQASDPAYHGHFANDAVRCERAGTAGEIYIAESEAAANASLDLWSVYDNHLALVACRPIAAGEEIFMSYGLEYWLEKLEKPPLRWNFPDGTCYFGEGVRIVYVLEHHARPLSTLPMRPSLTPLLLILHGCAQCNGFLDMSGEGELTHSDGSRYVGGFCDGEYSGPGTIFGVDGRAEVWRFEKGRGVGEGALWSADRNRAWRLRPSKQDATYDLRAGDGAQQLFGSGEGVQSTPSDNEVVYASRAKLAVTRQEVSLATAEAIAWRLGLPVPRRTVFEFMPGLAAAAIKGT